MVVGQLLRRAGLDFLVEVYEDRSTARALNHLLVTLFHLIEQGGEFAPGAFPAAYVGEHDQIEQCTRDEAEIVGHVLGQDDLYDEQAGTRAHRGSALGQERAAAFVVPVVQHA